MDEVGPGVPRHAARGGEFADVAPPVGRTPHRRATVATASHSRRIRRARSVRWEVGVGAIGPAVVGAIDPAVVGAIGPAVVGAVGQRTTIVGEALHAALVQSHGEGRIRPVS